MEKYYAYVGNWEIPNVAKKGGICIYSWDPQAVELTLIETTMKQINVGALCVNPKNAVLYATDERARQYGTQQSGGLLYTFQIDTTTGTLTQRDIRPSLGVFPCYLSVAPDINALLLTNLASGIGCCKTVKNLDDEYVVMTIHDDSNLVYFALDDNGIPVKAADVISHYGCSVHPTQTHARAHSVVSHPAGSIYLVCDKGADMIYLYKLDEKERKIIRLGSAESTIPGSAPRYGAFHPTLPVFYHNNELRPELCVFSYDACGNMTQLQRLPLLPEGYIVRENLPFFALPAPADTIIHPNGKYVYTTLRNPDHLIVHRVDEVTGLLTLIQNIPSGGKNPRAIRLDPTNRFAFVANLESAEVAIFSINDDGTLTDTNKRAPASSPGNIGFLKVT